MLSVVAVADKPNINNCFKVEKTKYRQLRKNKLHINIYLNLFNQCAQLTSSFESFFTIYSYTIMYEYYDRF